MNINTFSARLRNGAGVLELLAITAVSRFAPWLSPLPTAFLVFDRTVKYLDWPWLIALVAALSLELLGLSTTLTALELREYNKTKRKSDPSAPTALTYTLATFYFLSAEGLTVVLDIATKPYASWRAADFAPALFPVLSLVGVVLLAIRNDHSARLEAIRADKAQRRATSRQRKAEKAKMDIDRSGAVSTDGQSDNDRTRTGQMTGQGGLSDNGRYPWTRQTTKAQFLRDVAADPALLDVTPKRLGQLTGNTTRTGRRWKAAAAERVRRGV